MSEAKRIKELEDHVDRLDRRIDDIIEKSDRHLGELYARIKNLEDRGDT